MKTRTTLAIATTAALMFSGATSAQTLKAVQLDKPQIQAGQEVTATIDLGGGSSYNCGLRVHWGDGATADVRIQNEKDIPLRLSHTYAKAGSYQVTVDPEKIKSSLACVGKKARTTLAVVAAPLSAPVALAPVPAPAPVAAPAAAAAPAIVMARPLGPTCPDGWKLDAKSVVKKTGAFSCTARAGTALPPQRLDCRGNLGYFENWKKGVLGCRA